MTRKLVPVVAAFALLIAPLAFAGSIANQSEGAAVRDNVTVVGGVRGDGKAQYRAGSVAAGHSAALETSRVVKATPGTLYWLEFYNTAGSVRYLQLHNAAALPSDGAVPLLSIPVAATTGTLTRLFIPGIWCSTGIVLASSSTQATLTVSSADGFFSAGAR